MDRYIEKFAKARETASSGYYQDGSERDRGVGNERIQRLGVAGEIIARNLLKSNNKKFAASELVSKTADLRPDLFVEYSQTYVDVKCFDNEEFKINYKKIEYPRYEVEYFWIVKLEKEPNYASHYFFPFSDIRRNWVKRKAFTEYYSYNLNNTKFFATEDIYGIKTMGERVIGKINETD